MKKIFITIILFFLVSKAYSICDPNTDKDLIGTSIDGNFGSNNKMIRATVSLVKEGHGNLIDSDETEDSEPDEYIISFSDENMPNILIGCCDAILIWEGDLNNDGHDEFSVLQSPMNGCMSYWQTYTYQDNKWQILFDGFFVMSPYCEPPESWNQYLDMVTSENGNIYYMGRDPNSSELVKKRAVLK